jgi:anhydro-N-acetylmuramic acid kinase
MFLLKPEYTRLSTPAFDAMSRADASSPLPWFRFLFPQLPDPLSILGLMSGTSGDGIDGVLTAFRADGSFQLIWHEQMVFSPKMRQRLQRLMKRCSLNDSIRAGAYMGDLYAQAVELFRGRHSEEIHLLAAHGQTLRHLPEPEHWDGIPVRGTLQVLNAHLTAQKTGIPVIYDFRPADIAAGGQGAPLVPNGDLRFFGDPREARAIVNIGGIANVSILRPQPIPHVAQAFDTGPGNMLMDAAVVWATNGHRHYDAGGAMARIGHISSPLLFELLEDPYFAALPPKSTGRERFGTPRWLEILKSPSAKMLTPEDLVSTLLELTVVSLVDALRRFVVCDGPLDRVILAGGGALNPELVARLTERLTDICPVETSEAFGIPVEAREAMAFAALGERFVRGFPGNEPIATGAAHPAILGSLAFP